MVAGLTFRAVCVMLWLFAAAAAVQTKQEIASIQSLIRSQQYPQALKATDSALGGAPRDASLWALKGIVLSLMGENPKALAAFDQALSISPDNPAALKGEVQLLYPAQDKLVISLLHRILKDDPDDQTAHEMLGTLEARSGNCSAAVADFARSADVIQTHPASLDAYGSCLVETKQPEKAAAIFTQLSSLVPGSIPPQYDLAVALVESKQFNAALRILEPMLASDQSQSDLLRLASEAYEGIHETPKAVSLLRQAIVLNPSDPNAYNEFAALCLNHDSFQVGIDMISAGLQHVSNDASMYVSRGLLYAQLADYNQAEADFNTAEELDARQSVSSVARDLAELQQNQADKAHQEKLLLNIRSQLRTHPDDAYLHYLLAKVLMDSSSGKESEALESALLAVKLRPDFVEARDTLASLYLRSGRYDLAVEQCRTALQYAPADQSAMYHLIIALKHSGNGEKQAEIESLVASLSKLKQASIQQEADKKRFKLVEQQDRAPQ